MKRVTTKLSETHLRQVHSYAVDESVEWMVVTTRAVWQVCHLTGGLPVVDRVLEVDLLGSDTPANAELPAS